MQNGGFAQDLSKWEIDRTWDVNWIGEPGMNGQGVLRISASSSDFLGGSAAIWQCIRTEEHQLYDFGARYRVGTESSIGGGTTLRTVWYEKNNCSGKSAVGDWATPRKISGWQTLSVSETRPVAQAASVMIKLIQVVSEEGEFVTYWDDVYFRSGSTTTTVPEIQNK